MTEIAVIALYILSGILCMVGAVLSAITISGTWLVLGASVILALIREDPFPGNGTLIAFFAVAAMVEIVEVTASMWGVKKKGGSTLAGLASIAGGIAGIFFGFAIPIPILGNLIGMVAGGFIAAYLVECHRLQNSEQAMQIATGVIISRLLVMFLKVIVTMGMIVWLIMGMLL